MVTKTKKTAATPVKMSPKLKRELQFLGEGIAQLAQLGTEGAILGKMASSLTAIVSLLRENKDDRGWEKGDCHGYVWSTGDSQSVSCRGACPDDPHGWNCRQKSVYDQHENTTTTFCSCSEKEPTKCHLRRIEHHDTGATEIKCSGDCGTDATCDRFHHTEKFFNPPWHYYWCECNEIF